MNYPIPVWPYTPYSSVWDTVYLSGQIGLDPETMELEVSLWDQTHRVCSNILWVCKELGIDISDICKTTIYITNMQDFSKVNEIYGQYFSHKPARSCVGVQELPKGALVEIECIAYKK